jgi:uncharacterized protein (DUF58 family)
MPTGRARTFIIAAFVLYLFANQTQVGWIYVMSALMGGAVLAAGWLNRGSVRGISIERRITEREDYHEGEDVIINFSLHNAGGIGKAQLRAAETCPLAAPDSPQAQIQMFVPVLPLLASVEFDYTVVIDRRGLHEFLPVKLSSRAPFGFFEKHTAVTTLTRLLVYPEIKPLACLTLLDRRLVAQLSQQRAGLGYEVLGVRPFRSGDSPRHIHWRSVARTGNLMSKEFADEAQPGLTLVLDLYHHPYSQTQTKHTPFEYAVKAAASIGEYALRQGYPLYLLNDQEVMPVPRTAITWSSLMQVLARVQPNGTLPLADLIRQGVTQASVAVVMAWPDPAVVEPLVNLRRRGADILVVLVEPDSFPDSGVSAQALADQLLGEGLDVKLLPFGQDWAVILADSEESARFNQ